MARVLVGWGLEMGVWAFWARNGCLGFLGFLGLFAENGNSVARVELNFDRCCVNSRNEEDEY